MSQDRAHTDVGTVSWKSERYTKPCVRIRTRQGHEVTVALTHPMRKWGMWFEASELYIKDRLAVVRGGGEFTGEVSNFLDHHVMLAAYMVAEGHTPDISQCSFTQGEGPVLDEFLSIVDELGDVFNAYEKKRGNWALHFGSESDVWDYMGVWDMRGRLSADKHVPDFVWGLDQRQTALFLNRLWARDGHASLQGSSYHLEFDSTSITLARDVQRLLWKFGIPTSFRKWKPTLYKGTDKWAYKLRVETQPGALRFITQIGALGKTEDLPLIDVEEQSNRDTFPIEITEDLKAIHRSRDGYQRRGRFVPQPSLRSAGLREKPKYPLTPGKLQEYIDFFRSDPEFDQEMVDALAAHLDTDLFWDEIIEIEDMGEQPCYDIMVEGTRSFVADGFITHNSTTIGNKGLAYACIIPGFRVLYVSPSNTQTKTFSQDRLKDPILSSEELRVWTTNDLMDNVFQKHFINRSAWILRYAFLNADRVRGNAADLIDVDEFQNILLDNIPIIEECAFHSPYKLFQYSGTPLSLDNPIEYWWTTFSTQGEWVVPCDCKSGEGGRYWNILLESNIGKTSLICSRCGKPLNPAHPDAQWARMAEPRVEQPYEGFRIPQLMVPWLEWGDILDKQRKYPRAMFYNEVLGLSYDSGLRPLNRIDVQENCKPKQLLTADYLTKLRARLATTPLWMGIDWGTGESQSFTVVTFGAYIDGRFNIFYIHRFEGPESEVPVKQDIIHRLIQLWNPRRIGVDYGGGHYPNDDLIRRYGSDRVVKYQYSDPRTKVKWEGPLARWLVHRTEVMSAIFNAIKRRNVFTFPQWESFEDPFAVDMLNIFSEYNVQRRMIEYKKSPNCSDDSLHSLLYCFLVSILDNPRPDILHPSDPIKEAPEPYKEDAQEQSILRDAADYT